MGGVLVMPHNDQLLQITRTSQTDWEQKSVLPVSFSTLLLPNKADSKAHISLRKHLNSKGLNTFK